MAKKKSGNKIYDLKITLENVEPKVWRRLLVPESLFMDDLHALIQLSMGWNTTHLYDFKIGDRNIMEPDEEAFEAEVAEDPMDLTLADAIGKEKEFTYTYDFGDNWVHKIEVMGVIKSDPITQYPICIGGENACPPDDCGGTYGYEEFLEAMKDPKHEDHQQMKTWIGGYFDPKGFDANLVNRILRSPDPEDVIEELFERIESEGMLDA